MTEDGKSGPPSNVIANCKFDNISDMNYVEVQWEFPQKPNGLIEFYNVSCTFIHTYGMLNFHANIKTAHEFTIQM